jgi:peptide/nickel transport system substrate-binding protein
MYKRTIKTVILLILTVTVIVSTACSGKKADNSQMRFGLTTEPSTLDPLNPRNTADGRSILFNVFEGLVKPDSHGNMLPCIAESWAIEKNGLVYIFTLRQGLSFHDGSTLRAEDVKFSLDTAKEAGFIGLDRIEEVLVRDNKISITLKNADVEFLPFLTVGIVKNGNNDRENTIIGTGPFYVESYRSQQDLVLKKFKDYWQDGMPYLEKVTFIFHANYEAMLVSLHAGSIDGASITGAMAAQFDHTRYDIVYNHSAAVQLLAINNAISPFDDERVRLALNYGIDVQNIIDTAFFGSGIPSGSPLIPGLTLYYEEGLSYPYDPDKARSLLGQAGFNDSSNKLSLEITVASNYTMHIDTAQVIAGQLAKIGVDVNIKLVDWATWLSDVYSSRQYVSTIISLDSPIVSPRSFLSRYQSTARDNFINFSNVDFDRIYNDILTETDNTRRIRLYKEAQHVITESAASVYIQDILYFKAFRGGAYTGILNYPLYVTDFSTIHGKNKN